MQCTGNTAIYLNDDYCSIVDYVILGLICLMNAYSQFHLYMYSRKEKGIKTNMYAMSECTKNCQNVLVTRVLETAVRLCHGVRTYSVKADDFHIPSVFISESLKPALAAIVAAPMRKL